MQRYGKISRRTWLKGMLCSAAAGVSDAGVNGCRSQSQQGGCALPDYPNGRRTCSICKFFIPTGGGHSGMMGHGMMGHGMMMGAGACQVVEGRISPMGYCRGPVCLCSVKASARSF